MAQAQPLPPAAPSGLPSPRSPTLSCADMILPEAPLRSFSPNPYAERPPSPPSLSYTCSKRASSTITVISATPQARREPSPHIRSPPLSSRSSRSTLRTMGSADTCAKGKDGSLRTDNTIASSPTIADAMSRDPLNDWRHHEQKRLSNASSSMHSEDLEDMTWPAFDGPGAAAFDDSGVVLEEKGEERDRLPEISGTEDEMENEGWLEGHSDGDEEAYSSAALSRRAEMILANAKKRLNVMEGNLRGARQSLVISPTLTSMRAESALPHQLAAVRERDRRLYAGQGPIPPRTRPYYSSPLSSNSSPGHSRGMSETSVPVPFTPAYTSRLVNKRASSAMGAASGPWSPEGFGQGRFPIRESRSLEAVRDARQAWSNHEERDASLRSYDSRGSRSPSTLETLPEDVDSPQQQLRPSSTTGDLKAQMQDLKGRISSLKQKAKEDNLRRRSLQSLRTPSPFTCAEAWYASGDAYETGASPVTADAGVGTKTESPVRKTLFEEEEPRDKHAGSSSQHEASQYVADGKRSIKESSGDAYQKDSPTEHYNEDLQDYDDENSEDGLDDEFVSVDADVETGGDSVYEDAVYEFPITERHEDRIDAFDYEHFFLHSAMGSYSSGRSSRSSSSSADSVETTRPTTALYDGDVSEKRLSMHQRNASVDSVSTVASFATAAAEQSDDEGEDEEEESAQLNQFSQRLLPSQQSFLSNHTTKNALGLGITAPRSDSAINVRNKASSSPHSPALTTASQISRGSSPGSDLASGLQTSKIYNILLEAPPSSSQEEEVRLALNEEEKQLIYGLAASFQQVCARLQSTAGDRYERKEWRRRLDEARRVLSGEEVEDGKLLS
ncbi:uncharacterized protein EI97DRAFT_460131 [Westerdykella ornata]|uniref:Uncharacterized protein n=1 Tax=Westerdykella ornata TaxID=318751 RepID=A0A6A6JE44_WESOR|nr:uncharacterized protein EI97DRAFT_460131 [Westerdykella ornata]KAF2274557.1 hypothetical protein EI97DRAFT_460131 [Westerdykella ornata]